MARKRKDEGVPQADRGEVLPPARFVAPLRKPADVTMERKRLYRAVLNGRVPVDEAAKLNYMLNGIRADLEADAPPNIDQVPGGYVVDTVVINGVPSGHISSARRNPAAGVAIRRGTAGAYCRPADVEGVRQRRRRLRTATATGGLNGPPSASRRLRLHHTTSTLSARCSAILAVTAAYAAVDRAGAPCRRKSHTKAVCNCS